MSSFISELVHTHTSHAHYLQVARENFDRFFKLYLSGKADMLPPKAREFFDQFNWQRFGVVAAADRIAVLANLIGRVYNTTRNPFSPYPGAGAGPGALAPAALNQHLEDMEASRWELVVVRPNIEHNMLGIIMGRGGLDELGATFWGQTELSCYDDSMHGKDMGHTVQAVEK